MHTTPLDSGRQPCWVPPANVSIRGWCIVLSCGLRTDNTSSRMPQNSSRIIFIKAPTSTSPTMSPKDLLTTAFMAVPPAVSLAGLTGTVCVHHHVCTSSHQLQAQERCLQDLQVGAIKPDCLNPDPLRYKVITTATCTIHK